MKSPTLMLGSPRKGRPDRALAATTPPMPSGMPSAAQAVWKRVVPRLAGLNLLADVDAVALEIYCRNCAEWRRIQRIAESTTDPWETKKLSAILRGLESTTNTLARAFALHPRARKSLQLPVTPPADHGDDS